MIDGVKLRDLSRFEDWRGYLIEAMRKDWPEFKSFAQCYVTSCKPGIAKAWHYHQKQTDSFVVVKGEARIALYDAREGSKTKGEVNEFVVNAEKPKMVQIPPGVLHGFTSNNSEDVLMLNLPDRLFKREKPDEFRKPFDSKEIPYDWKCEKGG